MQSIIQKIYPYYQAIRQQIHAHPELRYEEQQTAELVAAELRKLGLTPQMQIGKTGVVAVLDSGKPGKTVALRADMDALPILEDTDLSYTSQNQGKMHACGHDGHTASLLATAHVLCELKHTFSGKIKFIFQPAEEGGAGAKAMIEDGELDNPVVDVIFAYHNSPGLPVGAISAKPGCTMYGNTEFTIEIIGKGGHAAQPELVNNPITIAADLIQAVAPIIQTLIAESEPTVVSLTTVHAGLATNVIPETLALCGTIRAASLEKSQHAQVLLKQVFEKVALKAKAQINATFRDQYPPTINTPTEAEFVLTQAKQLFGEAKVSTKAKLSRASEDFSYFLQKIPGCYFFIGNGDSAACHSSHYNFDDAVLPYAIGMLSTIAIEFLNNT